MWMRSGGGGRARASSGSLGPSATLIPAAAVPSRWSQHVEIPGFPDARYSMHPIGRRLRHRVLRREQCGQADNEG
ncbi:hypothetical protein G6F57_019541 [Rhizopus arrhizus]|nr:hypothetical protein G6F23_015952 [Rhizopus arrhizus]KAG1167862.1 hypothetical protein G6F35_017598 [Rhizopus arrhizus]KAG1439153.1 hypothetical protein G6F57_019541 [Rhizopus arrhizus]